MVRTSAYLGHQITNCACVVYKKLCNDELEVALS